MMLSALSGFFTKSAVAVARLSSSRFFASADSSTGKKDRPSRPFASGVFAAAAAFAFSGRRYVSYHFTYRS